MLMCAVSEKSELVSCVSVCVCGGDLPGLMTETESVINGVLGGEVGHWGRIRQEPPSSSPVSPLCSDSYVREDGGEIEGESGGELCRSWWHQAVFVNIWRDFGNTVKTITTSRDIYLF